MENFEANWRELKSYGSEVGVKREQLTKVFYDYYLPILQTRASFLINEYRIPNIDGDTMTFACDTLTQFWAKKLPTAETLVFNNADDLKNYLFKILLNLINRKSRKNKKWGDFFDHQNQRELDFDDEHDIDYGLLMNEFDSFERVAAVVKLIKGIYHKSNEFCFKLLNDLLIEGFNYNEILQLENYQEFNYSSIRKRKSRCLEELVSFLNKNKNLY